MYGSPFSFAAVYFEIDTAKFVEIVNIVYCTMTVFVVKYSMDSYFLVSMADVFAC